MKVYDIESFCSDIKTILTTYLNSKLTSIDSEKNDGITLKPVASDAYFFQELNEATVNYDPYILYSVENIESEALGPVTSLRPTVHIILVLADQGSELAGIGTRMLRYQRALKEIFESHWTENQNGVKIKVQSLVPVQFSLMNSANSYRAIGIALTGDIG